MPRFTLKATNNQKYVFDVQGSAEITPGVKKAAEAVATEKDVFIGSIEKGDTRSERDIRGEG